jgi:uncharacterized membrane protein
MKKNEIQHSQKSNNNQVGHKQIEATFQHYQGPLPSPDILASFEQIVPGIAKSICNNFLEESQHRRAIEKDYMTNENRNSRLGVIFGFTLGMTGLVGGVIVAIYSNPASGAIIAGGSLASLVGVFVYGTKNKLNNWDEETILK